MTPTPEDIALAERIASESHDRGSIAWCAAYDASIEASLDVKERVTEFLRRHDYGSLSSAIRNGEHLK